MAKLLSKNVLNERLYTELKDGVQRNTDAIKRLNEGLDIIEKNNAQSLRQLEKVVLAEIQQRKQSNRDFEETIQSQHEKCTYAIQSFQETIGGFATRLENQNDIVRINLHFFILNFLFFGFYWLIERIRSETRQNQKKLRTSTESLEKH